MIETVTPKEREEEWEAEGEREAVRVPLWVMEGEGVREALTVGQAVAVGTWEVVSVPEVDTVVLVEAEGEGISEVVGEREGLEVGEGLVDGVREALAQTLMVGLVLREEHVVAVTVRLRVLAGEREGALGEGEGVSVVHAVAEGVENLLREGC